MKTSDFGYELPTELIAQQLVDTGGEILWTETLTGTGRSDGGPEPIAHFNRAFDGLLGQALASLAAALE